MHGSGQDINITKLISGWNGLAGSGESRGETTLKSSDYNCLIPTNSNTIAPTAIANIGHGIGINPKHVPSVALAQSSGEPENRIYCLSFLSHIGG